MTYLVNLITGSNMHRPCVIVNKAEVKNYTLSKAFKIDIGHWSGSEGGFVTNKKIF